ncbi:ZPR1 zinc finger domain-containing protein [Candidatus Woesearchaeota archaeon]|nr:ZPR1 zinc finger domain-containing protein [Candidatus Woesearchaeota archaeon]
MATELKGQLCPACGENKSILREDEVDIPHFGKVYVLTLECEACGYKKSDLEPAEEKEPCRFTFELESDVDLNVKVVKSGEATLKIPHIITIEPGVASDGYITNIEGLLEKVKKMIESSVDAEEDDDDAVKKSKNLIKKLNRALAGQEKLKIIIEDPTGHSAIISDKAVKSKL